jgi:hypothetical protein
MVNEGLIFEIFILIFSHFSSSSPLMGEDEVEGEDHFLTNLKERLKDLSFFLNLIYIIINNRRCPHE